MNSTIGLVLSGGGYRGVAHIGAIKALEEFGIVPNVISGTSAGALVGALYAANYNPEEMLAAFKSIKLFGFSRYARKQPGFVDSSSFEGFLHDYFPDNSFDSLSKKLFVTATDLLSGRAKVFRDGELIRTILASAAFPGIFTPVNIAGDLYADGGILDNFPIQPVSYCNKIYGIYVSPVKPMQIADFKHSYDVVNRAFQLRMHQSSRLKFRLCDMVINPPELGDYRIFNSNHIDELFEIGYRSTFMELQKKASEQHYMEEY
ncbi:patatin-like phospholipase family protein [Poritiphilus flavus]|uniref:Patatin n=1 Tax=Poritiphilus flavus TaxID=2697053 RepID=A0A6L9EAX0_9FLAO|nr:patatin-like phospholipase family protein [Poritiphilus flavus]NAS11907.1 patatin [Poritiphilus flavus]